MGQCLLDWGGDQPGVDTALTARPRYLLHAQGVDWIGQRTLLDGDTLFNDVILLPAPFFEHQEALSRFPHEFRATPGVTRDSETLLIEPVREADIIRIDEPVVALTSTEARNYGSWLFRILPKLLLLEGDLAHVPGPRALFLPQEASWMREIVSHFAPGRRVVAQDITRRYHLSDVVAPSLPAPSNIFPPQVTGALASARHNLPPTPFGRRIYVSRRQWSEAVGRRVLEDEPALVEALARDGIQEVVPESLTLPQRMAAFAGADLIVGPTGSGLFNVVFARPGARVLEIEPHAKWRSMHAALYRSLGLDCGFVRGHVTGPGSGPDHPAWNVDVPSVVQAARAFARWRHSSLRSTTTPSPDIEKSTTNP
jgi:capsular polysaccharide biosynthesis protein